LISHSKFRSNTSTTYLFRRQSTRSNFMMIEKETHVHRPPLKNIKITEKHLYKLTPAISSCLSAQNTHTSLPPSLSWIPLHAPPSSSSALEYQVIPNLQIHTCTNTCNSRLKLRYFVLFLVLKVYPRERYWRRME